MKGPVLFDCYIHLGLKDSAPDFYQLLCNKLSEWKINFELSGFLTEEKEHVFICAADSYVSAHGKYETLVIVPTKGESKESILLKKKNFWLSPADSWESFHELLFSLNQKLLKAKTKTIKEKLESTLDYLSQSQSLKTPLTSELELEELLQKKLKIKKYKVLSLQELFLDQNQSFEFILPLPKENQFLGFSGKLADKDIALLNFFLKKKYEENALLEESGSEIIDEAVIEEAFRTLSLPMALISKSSGVLLHNAPFVKLNLSPDQCLHFPHQAKVNLTSGETFLVYRKNLDPEGKKIFFCLRPQEHQDLKVNKGSEELGIISSSIAHELNNPLAGIMAAIGLLSLDDNWSDEARTDLDEMKRGSARCKALVETFLGFSRMNPENAKKGSFDAAFEQAMSLIRFRLVENNLKLSFIKDLESSRTMINSSIFSMVLYLIMGELITALSHQLLVERADKSGLTIEGRIFIEKIAGAEALVLKVHTAIDFEEGLKTSKLIKHLLEMENFKLQVDKRQIVIST